MAISKFTRLDKEKPDEQKPDEQKTMKNKTAKQTPDEQNKRRTKTRRQTKTRRTTQTTTTADEKGRATKKRRTKTYPPHIHSCFEYFPMYSNACSFMAPVFLQRLQMIAYVNDIIPLSRSSPQIKPKFFFLMISNWVQPVLFSWSWLPLVVP